MRLTERGDFGEDVVVAAASQVSEVAGRVGGTPWEEGDGWSIEWPPHFFVLCFTEAELLPDEEGHIPPFTCNVWHFLELAGAAEERLAENGEVFGADEQRGAAQTIRAAYEREPWLVPDGEG